jgi:hypothetical protein
MPSIITSYPPLSPFSAAFQDNGTNVSSTTLSDNASNGTTEDVLTVITKLSMVTVMVRILPSSIHQTPPRVRHTWFLINP